MARRPLVRTTRTKSTRRPERVQALGPAVMGQPLDGSYSALHGVEWGLYWHRSRGLILEQRQGGAWVEVQPGQAFPELTRTTRHISLAFDQAARHVACWEDDGQIVVRQWDTGQQQYVYVGPFPGVDPVLLNDTTVTFFEPDSDVLLMYLNEARDTLVYRLQRDAYGVERILNSGLNGAVLDQLVTLGYRWELLGQEADGTDLVVVGGLYPVRAVEAARGTAFLTSGLYELMLFEKAAQDVVAGLGAFKSGLWETQDLRFNIPDPVTGSAAFASTSRYEQTQFAKSNTDALSGVGKFLNTSKSEAIGVPHSSTDALGGSAAFKGGVYGP